MNRYSYVLNDPIKYKDPTGHWYEEEGIGREEPDPTRSTSSPTPTPTPAPLPEATPTPAPAPAPTPDPPYAPDPAFPSQPFDWALVQNLADGLGEFLDNLGSLSPDLREKIQEGARQVSLTSKQTAMAIPRGWKPADLAANAFILVGDVVEPVTNGILLGSSAYSRRDEIMIASGKVFNQTKGTGLTPGRYYTGSISPPRRQPVINPGIVPAH